MMYLTLWEMNESLIPKDPEERGKLLMSMAEMTKKAVDSGEEAGPMTFQLAKKLEYGLKLVRERAGMDSFIITREAVTDMESYINGLVKRFYQQEDGDN